MEREEFLSWLKSPQEDRDDEEYYIFLPYSDLRGWVYTGEVIFQASEAFPAGRLRNIRQLSFLTYVSDENPITEAASDFTHNRFDHTLVVARTSEQISRQNLLSEDKIREVVIASVLHDIALPALGDATKAIDPEKLNEETNWQSMLDEKGRKYLESNGVKEEELDAIIKNEGLQGKVLDIADKITYILKDFHEFTNSFGSITDKHTQELRKEILNDPEIGNIYKEVVVDKTKNDVYFLNPKRLGVLLKIRALLFKKLYLHPVSMGRDFKFANLIEPFYTRDEELSHKLITPNRLRKMGDDDLISYLTHKYYGPNDNSYMFYSDLISWFPRYWEKYNTLEEVTEDYEELRKNKYITVIGVKKCKGFNPCIDYKVLDNRGDIVEFREYDPKKADEIESINRDLKGFYVFFGKKSKEETQRSNLLGKVAQDRLIIR